MRRTKRVLAGVLSALLSVLLLLQTTGCTSWPTVAQPWPTTIAQHPNRKVRVTLLDQTTVEGDSAGVQAERVLVYHPTSTDTLAFYRVGKIQFRKFNPWKTAGVIAGVVAAPIAAVLIHCGSTPLPSCG